MTPKDPRSCVGTQPESSPLGITLAELVLWAMLILVIILPGCGDGKAEPRYSIEGEWYNLTHSSPDWLYTFRNGLLTQSVSHAGVPLSTKTYPYAERGDTLYIGGDQQDPPRRWLLRWECHNVVEVRQLDVQFSTLRWLVRE